jgi:drug/metabolite transporter (DMT)-like permease
MSGGRMIGVVFGFVGVFVLMGAPDGGSFLAHVAVLTAAVSYAFASIFGKRFRAMGVAPLATATGQVSASALILLPIVLVVDQPWALAMPSGGAIAALVALALLSTSFAYFLYFRILSTAGATNLALVTFLIPPSAIMLGVLALDEVLLLRQILGMAIIGAGLAAIDGRVFRAFGR